MSAVAPRSDVALHRSETSLRANNGSDQFYSITLSARARNDSGTVKPIALAVLRLTTSSNLVGCSIRQMGRLGSAKELHDLPGHDIPIELNKARPVSNKTSLLCLIRPLVYRWQAQGGRALDDHLPINEEERRRQNVKCRGF